MPKKPITRNIVEEEGWKRYDWAETNGISQWSSDSAHDDWENMGEDTCQELVGGLVKAALMKQEQKKITPEDLERICEELKEKSWDNLENVFYAILDAYTWAWEVAYTPSDDDIERAIKKAKGDWWSEVREADYWNLIVGVIPEGPREWTPRPNWTEEKVFEDLDERVSYKRKPNYYDRYMVFDWPAAESIRAMRAVLRENPKEGSLEELETEVDGWVDLFMRSFFKALEDGREHMEPWQRFDLDPHWKSVLKDKQRMAGVRKEILEFLATPKKEEVE